jgi:hypothetical protein
MRRPREGEIIAFNYLHSDPHKERIGKVVRVRDTEAEPIDNRTLFYSPDVHRSRFLITCSMADGTYRAFYHTGILKLRRLSLRERLGLWLYGVRFSNTSQAGDATAEA